MMTQLMLLEEAHRWRSRKGGRGVRSTPKQKLGGGADRAPHISVTIPVTFCDFTVPIFCPQTTQEQPKKHSEAGSPEHLLVSL